MKKLIFFYIPHNKFLFQHLFTTFDTFHRRLPTAEHINQFLKCYAGELDGEHNQRHIIDHNLETAVVNLVEKTKQNEGNSQIHSNDGRLYFRAKWLKERLLKKPKFRESPDLQSGIKFIRFLDTCRDLIVIQKHLVGSSASLKPQKPSFKPQKLDNAIINLLSTATPTETNSRTKMYSKDGCAGYKLFFKVGWVKEKLPGGVADSLSKSKMIEYLRDHDKFIANQDCVHVASIIANMPTEQTLLEKVDEIIKSYGGNVTLENILSHIKSLFRQRVRNSSALATFLAGYPTKYETVCGMVQWVNRDKETSSNVIHRVAIPQLSRSSSVSSIVTTSSAVSRSVDEKDKITPLSPDEIEELITLVMHLLIKDIVTSPDMKVGSPDKKWFPISGLLKEVKRQFNNVTESQLKDLLLHKTDIFGVSACNQVRLKNETFIEFAVLMRGQPEEFLTDEVYVNLISVHNESSLYQLHIDKLVDMLKMSAVDQAHCYIGQGMMLFWSQSWVRKMLPHMPWKQVEHSAKFNNSTIMIDSGQQRGIGLVKDTDGNQQQILRRVQVTGRILQYIGDEFGLILANGKIISFIVNCVCDRGKYVEEDYNVKENLYIGKLVCAVVDYEIEVDQIPMAIAVSSNDGKLVLTVSISPRLQLLLKSKFQAAMRKEWLATLPNGNLGRTLRDPLLKYIALLDMQSLGKWLSVPVFRSHVILKNKSLVFDETLQTSTSTLLRLILPENKMLRNLQYPTNTGGIYANLPLPAMTNAPKITFTAMGSLLLVDIKGAVWRTREADGVDILITAPDGVIFSILYANMDARLGPIFVSLPVGSIVHFNLAGSENSCGAIVPSISQLKVLTVDPKIVKASKSVLAGDTRYVGYLYSVEPAVEARNDNVAVLDGIVDLLQEDDDVCDVTHLDFFTIPSEEADNPQ